MDRKTRFTTLITRRITRYPNQKKAVSLILTG